MTKDKLHLGCGRCYLPPEQGWINIDFFTSGKADAYYDVTSLPYDKESFSLLYASHLLEHVHRFAVVATLAHWRSLLKPGGILRLAVPNFAAIVEWYRRTGSLDDVMGLLYGRQDMHLNRHTVAFDEKTLTRDLRKVGFMDIRPWDWRKTEHADYDDFSRCRLPHMSQSDDALWMSLNLQAIK
jgi:Uncharacterized protein conserved in bacteria